MILQIYTIIHTLISLIAVFTGVVVLFGLLAGNRVDGWTKWFLITAVLTTVTGFFFPFHGFTPAIGLGIISLPFLALTIFARYRKNLARGLALDLHRRRSDLSLFQSFRAGRAIVREDSGSACACADANRVSIQTYPARRAHDFRFALHCRVDPFSS